MVPCIFGICDSMRKESGDSSQTNSSLEFWIIILRLGFGVWGLSFRILGLGRVLGTNCHGFHEKGFMERKCAQAATTTGL